MTEPADPGGGDTPSRGAGRPILERIGMASIALVVAALFAVVGLASWSGGELFLTVMALIGCVMTAWVGLLTLVRG